MRRALTCIVVFMILSAGITPLCGAHPIAAKDRRACCKMSRVSAGCEGTPKPMPCCKIRPIPGPTADLPPSAARAEAPGHLQLPTEMPSPAFFLPAGLTSVHPNDPAALSNPPRLYRLHSAYLV